MTGAAYEGGVAAETGAAYERAGTGAAYGGPEAAWTVAKVDAGAAYERAGTRATYERAGTG